MAWPIPILDGVFETQPVESTKDFHLRWKRREGREDKSAYLQRVVRPHSLHRGGVDKDYTLYSPTP